MSFAQIGLIGAGPWGQRYISCFKKITTSNLVAVASQNPETRHLVPSDCIIFDDWKEMIQSKKCHGIIIATPPHIHLEMLAFCLQNNVPVLIEKPISTDLIALEEFNFKYQFNKTPVLVNHIHLFNPAFEQLIELTKNQVIQSIVSMGGSQGPYRKDYSPLWDYGPHDLSMILTLVNSMPKSIKARQIDSDIHSYQSNKGSFECLLNFEGTYPLNASLKCGNTFSVKQRRLEVKGKGFHYIIDDQSESKLVSLLEGVVSPIQIEARVSPLENVIKVFIELLQGKDDSRKGLMLALKITKLLSQCEALVRCQ